MTSETSAPELPKQYDHQAAQAQWSAFWEKQGYFHAVPDETRQPFSIVIPPPNVTGALHLGHALNNTLQDILIRWRRMQGYNALWMPGTDHAGIATQAIVERRLFEEEKLTRHDLGREKLVARIWKWKEEYEKRILGQLKMLGCSCDWERTRFTLDPLCARAVRRTFFTLFRDSLIYRGKRLVNWDTFLQTAVSDDEVFHEVTPGHFWHFKYPVIDPQPGEPKFVTIATTRPETMLGDTAVAVHPDPAAALDELEAELRAKLAATATRDRAGIETQIADLQRRRTTHLPELIELRDMALAGRCVMLPLVQREIPLVADAWAKPELGSGCVKITPAHDANDYEVGLRCGLPMINILNPDGTLNASAGTYVGQTMKQARANVVADLEEEGLLVEIEDREIDLAHSDRSKTPIEPYLADQWFVKMDHLAQTAMDAVTDGRVRIQPERYAKGYLDWLGEKRDWPVGRQLWWGHRIPIWSKTVPMPEGLAELQAQLDAEPAILSGKAVYQVEFDEERQIAEQHDRVVQGAEKVLLPYAMVHVSIDEDEPELERRIESLGFEQESDVLDTWFSSALWPHSTLGWPEQTPELKYFYPTSVLITSRDIITLWVARMVLAGLYNTGEVPFKDVYIHPKILDRDGEGMSKSKGNGVDPIDVIEKFGADALRFGIAYLTTETQDVRVPVEFECPGCGASIDQTKKNRVLPRIVCPKCQSPFSTQWASKPEDVALPRAAVTSERFELGRNFCNKMWNASRFALMHLTDYTPEAVKPEELAVEDRWLLSRLATVTRAVTQFLETYKYADAARCLYDFGWDEFCSFYVEMAKARLEDPSQRAIAQRMLAHALDILMRLLHPMIPFLTEEVWQRLGEVAPQRGLSDPQARAASVMIAPWPEAELHWQAPEIEERFAQFQAVLGGLREIRSSQNIAPREKLEFSVHCDARVTELLQPMEPYFLKMANAQALAWGPNVEAPESSASRSLPGLEMYVDMRDFIDIPAEIQRNEKERDRLRGQIDSKHNKLQNESFVSRAKPEIVQAERDKLVQLQQELANVDTMLARLKANS
jgi:valyl-tRNA synthetase